MKLNLAQILKDYGLLQKELASILSMSPQSISNYVNGRRTLSFEQSIKIAQHLNVPIETLLDENKHLTVISKEDFDKIRKYQKAIDEIMKKYDDPNI